MHCGSWRKLNYTLWGKRNDFENLTGVDNRLLRGERHYQFYSSQRPWLAWLTSNGRHLRLQVPGLVSDGPSLCLRLVYGRPRMLILWKRLVRRYRSWRFSEAIDRLEYSLVSHRKTPISSVFDVVRSLPLPYLTRVELLALIEETQDNYESAEEYLEIFADLRPNSLTATSYRVRQYRDAMLMACIEYLRSGEWKFGAVRVTRE